MFLRMQWTVPILSNNIINTSSEFFYLVTTVDASNFFFTLINYCGWDDRSLVAILLCGQFVDTISIHSAIGVQLNEVKKISLLENRLKNEFLFFFTNFVSRKMHFKRHFPGLDVCFCFLNIFLRSSSVAPVSILHLSAIWRSIKMSCIVGAAYFIKFEMEKKVLWKHLD